MINHEKTAYEKHLELEVWNMYLKNIYGKSPMSNFIDSLIKEEPPRTLNRELYDYLPIKTK